jgi:Tol biopolymer transport system component/cytosine/adenosine deaminase-related metal-dependent hydrolase
MMRTASGLAALAALGAAWVSLGAQAPASVAVPLTEGTNIAAARSPDGRTITIDLQGTLWTLPATGGVATALTPERLDARQPVWAPDGQSIAFQGYRDGTWNIWTVAPDGSGLTARTWGPFDDREPHWSPDGTRLAFSSDRTGHYDVWTLTLETGALERITTDPANDFAPAFSPDGREIAYASDREAAPGIYVMRDRGERLAAGTPDRANNPSWHPDGRHLLYTAFSMEGAGPLAMPRGTNPSRLVVGGRDVTEGEDVFPFRAQWLSPTEILYTADGRIRRRILTSDLAPAGPPIEIPFTATVTLERRPYEQRRRVFPRPGPQPTLGIMRPAIAPDGRTVAFAALGDLWTMEMGRQPRRLTSDAFVETEPTWSPDGRQLAYLSDRAGSMDIWVRDVSTGAERRATELPGAETSPAWSPDGWRLAFVSDGEVFIVDLKSGDGEKVHDRLFSPGRPSWAPDGRALVLSVLRPYSSRFREGTNQVLRIDLDTRTDRHLTPVAHRSAGSRDDDGPVWSPDGTYMALVMDGILTVLPVDREGQPTGPPRRLSTELATSPSWTGDSRRLLYQTDQGLRLVSLDDGSTSEVAVELQWTPKVTSGRIVVHAGALFDGTTPTLRRNVDIVVEGNRITAVEPHGDAHHTGTVVDAGSSTVMPGLIEMHTHLSKAFGEVQGRIWLAYGITSIRNPAANPFEALEDEEAVEAGVRLGPRVFTTGGPFDGTRIYYAGGAYTDGGGELALQLARVRRLGFDLVKTYVRLPDLVQRRVIDEAHRAGLPVTSHEIYPAVKYGADGVEHLRGTSRRGYSPKLSQLNRSYGDVIALLAASKMTITPTIGIQGAFTLLTLRDPSWLDDPRARLYPAGALENFRKLAEARSRVDLAARAAALAPLGRTVARVVEAGGVAVAGTDSPIIPIALSLQTELEHFVEGGLTPFQALQTATVHAARALGMGGSLGAVAPGHLADLLVVDGNPLADVRTARRIRTVIRDGEVLALEDLLRRP